MIGICQLIPEPFRSRLVAASIQPIKGHIGEYETDSLEKSIKRINEIRSMALNAHPWLFVDKKEEKVRARIVEKAENNADVSKAISLDQEESIRHKAGAKALADYIRDGRVK